MFKKIGIFIASAFVLLAGQYASATSTVSTIPTELGSVLDEIVQAIISTFLTFISDNLPLIVVLGVTVGMVFWLIRKTRGALTGR